MRFYDLPTAQLLIIGWPGQPPCWLCEEFWELRRLAADRGDA
jgi:hypothetical protein